MDLCACSALNIVEHAWDIGRKEFLVAVSVVMSNQLFIGRLPLGCRSRDIEDIFYRYGKMSRCDVKQGGRALIRENMFRLTTIASLLIDRNEDV